MSTCSLFLVSAILFVFLLVLVAVDAGGFVSFSGVLVCSLFKVGVVVFAVVVVFFLGEKKESI